MGMTIIFDQSTVGNILIKNRNVVDNPKNHIKFLT